MALEPLGTAAGSEFPLCRQLTVFLENRLGQLIRLTRLLDRGDLHILSISVDPSADCALVRLLIDKPDDAFQMIREAGFACVENEVLVVELPQGKRGIMTTCIALLSGEINIDYTYPLMPGVNRGACLAFHLDNIHRAAEVLSARKFRLLDQSEL